MQHRTCLQYGDYVLAASSPMKIRRADLDSTMNAEHADLGLPPLETKVTRRPGAVWRDKRYWFAASALLFLAGGAVWFMMMRQAGGAMTDPVTPLLMRLLSSPEFWAAVGVGFAAQAIDGALGMAYGISSTTFLLGTGASPAAASAAVHIAEVFTTGFSGASHLKFGNVEKKLFWRLVVPGMIGGVAGAYVLTSIDGKMLKPYVSAYLLLMGLYILVKAWRAAKPRKGNLNHVGKLALTGGFVDAVGGGGWGPVVTSTLVGRGNNPRTTIGTVNTAEFFIALATAASFAWFSELSHLTLIAGLVFGGLFAAPFAAWLCHKLPARALLWMVGVLITGLSAFNLYKSLA